MAGCELGPIEIWDNMEMLNSIDADKLYGILCRICFAISTCRNFVFTKDEFNKLQLSLNVEPSYLENLCEKIKDILFQAVENSLEPNELREKLITSGLEANHAEMFSDQWCRNRDEIIAAVNQLSFSKWQLKSVAWQFHTEVASINTARERHPIAVMNLSLYEPTPLPKTCQTNNEETTVKTKDIKFQMDYEELSEFYRKLEQVQHEIDNLK